MARTINTKLELEPEEYGRLEELARQTNTSVEELIRQAVRKQFFDTREQIEQSISQILSMELPVVFTGEWESIEEELLEAHRGPLP